MATVRKPPKRLDAQATLVDKDGKPTREFYLFLIALLEWAKEADAELE